MTLKKRYILLLLLFMVLMNTGVYAQTTITGATGNYPTAAALDADANIYVVQYDAGNDEYDVVRYTAASGYTSSSVIYNGVYFDGEYPTDIEVDSNGDVYVLDGFDEPASTGAILRLDASNGYNSSTVPLLGNYPVALGIDGNDDIYVSEYDGGTDDYQVVKYDVSAGYTSTVLYNGLGLDTYPRGLTGDHDGNVYVLTSFGLDAANGKILKLTAPGYGSTTVDQGDYYTGLAINGHGDLFASAYNSGADNYSIVKYTNGSGAPTSVVTGLTYSGSSYPTGLGSNLGLGDIVIPDPWNASNGTVTYLDQPEPSFPPSVSTTAASGVGTTSATLAGEVTDDGGTSVTERGIVWATTTAPDTGDNKVAIGAGTGSFSQSVGLLPFGTTIYYRAYATNSEGTSYGSEESFTTSNTVTRDLTGVEGWRLLAPPASVPLSTFLDPIWTQGATTGGDTDFGTPNVYTWGTSTAGNDQADWQAVTDLSGTTLVGGHGVLVQVYADDDYDSGTADGFPQTLSVTSNEYASGVSPAMNSNTDGWTLLGNPFASAVTFSDLSPTNLTNIVYVWDPNDDTGDGGQDSQPSGSWKTWNGGTGDLTGGHIAPFQGFLVQNNGAGGSSVTFTQASKTSTATPFLGKENQNTTPFVRLELQGNGMRNAAWMEFTPEGSSEQTTGDAWELQPLSGQYALLATRKADGAMVDIGRYPHGELEIPLITEATQPGNYTIQVTDFEAPGHTLYLSDLQTGESIRLEKDTRYEFTINQTAKTPADPLTLLQSGLQKKDGSDHRFVISTSALDNQPDETPQTFTLEQNYPNPFNPSTVISYQLPENSRVRLEVFDMAGRQIATLISGQQEAGSHTVNFDGSNLSSGVYMYRLHANGNVFTKKLTLIK